jgi:hypothetical protein
MAKADTGEMTAEPVVLGWTTGDPGTTEHNMSDTGFADALVTYGSTAASVAAVAGLGAQKWTLVGSEKWELRSKFEPVRLAPRTQTILRGRLMLTDGQLVFGLLPAHADSFGSAAIVDGVWFAVADGGTAATCKVARDAASTGDWLSVNSGIPMTRDSVVELMIEINCLSTNGKGGVVWYVNGTAAARMNCTNLPYDADLWPRIGAYTAGELSVVQFGRAVYGSRRP